MYTCRLRIAYRATTESINCMMNCLANIFIPHCLKHVHVNKSNQGKAGGMYMYMNAYVYMYLYTCSVNYARTIFINAIHMYR